MSEKSLLNEEEQKLCTTAPEECLRRLIARGGLSLDSVMAKLPPQVAEAVRVIASGERVTPAGEVVHLQESDRDDEVGRVLKAPLPAGERSAPAPDWTRAFAAEFPQLVRQFEARPAVPDQVLKAPRPAGTAAAPYPEWARAFATAYPSLVSLLEERHITPKEAVAAVQAIDGCLGNYVTGTRYGAP